MNNLTSPDCQNVILQKVNGSHHCKDTFIRQAENRQHKHFPGIDSIWKKLQLQNLNHKLMVSQRIIYLLPPLFYFIQRKVRFFSLHQLLTTAIRMYGCLLPQPSRKSRTCLFITAYESYICSSFLINRTLPFHLQQDLPIVNFIHLHTLHLKCVNYSRHAEQDMDLCFYLFIKYLQAFCWKSVAKSGRQIIKGLGSIFEVILQEIRFKENSGLQRDGALGRLVQY